MISTTVFCCLLGLVLAPSALAFTHAGEWDTPERLATANTNCEIAKRARLLEGIFQVQLRLFTNTDAAAVYGYINDKTSNMVEPEDWRPDSPANTQFTSLTMNDGGMGFKLMRYLFGMVDNYTGSQLEDFQAWLDKENTKQFFGTAVRDVLEEGVSSARYIRLYGCPETPH